MNGPLPSFEKLQQREQASGKIKIDHLAKTLPATYIVFDVLYVGDKSVMGLSQMERKAILPDLVEVDDRVVLSDYIEAAGSTTTTRSLHAVSRASSRSTGRLATRWGKGARTGSRSRRRRRSTPSSVGSPRGKASARTRSAR